ncbi:MAG: hypothetical protein PUA83_02265 [Clostridiales bacterium]|nr:hypothetical protein [Clostridiales bacterium]
MEKTKGEQSVSSKLLPVKIPNDLSAVFFYALPAACLCGDPDYADWYHMNYLDFYGYKNTANREKYEFRFVDAVSYVDRGLHINDAVGIDRYDMQYFSCLDLIGFLKQRIDTWNYTVLYVDESKIPDSPFSSAGHEYLVYGYDDGTQELYMLGMNRQHRYAEMKLSYSVVSEAFDSLIQNFSHGRILYQLCVTNRYTSLAGGENRYFSHHIVREYREEVFVHKIRTYLSGGITEGSLRVINGAINPKAACGIDTAEVLRLYLSEVEAGENQFEFNVPFFFLDHKKCVRSRLLYAYEKTGRGMYRDAAEEYGGVVSAFEHFKNVHIKKLLKNDCDLRFLNELLDKATEAERNILSRV